MFINDLFNDKNKTLNEVSTELLRNRSKETAMPEGRGFRGVGGARSREDDEGHGRGDNSLAKEYNQARLERATQERKELLAAIAAVSKKQKGIKEAIPYALSAANAAAEYRRQGQAGGGYRGRIDIPVQSREDYLAVGQALTKAARAAGQQIEYGLSDGVMSVFSDSMDSNELDQFIDDVLNQGLEEGILGDREYNRVMPFVKRIASEVSDYDRDEFGEELWSLLDQKYGSKFAQSVLQDSLNFYWDTYTELTGQGLDEASVYKKDQDLSSIPTQELEAFVNKHWAGGIPTYGQGESVKRAMRELRRRQKQGVAEGSLNEFAPDGFNGGDDDDEGFSPEIAKMAQEDGFTKGAGLADGATLARAITINHWHNQHGGMYKQYFAKGFKAGRMDKIRHNNKQYNLNLKLMKDGSIRHGEQGVAEGGILDDLLDAPGKVLRTAQDAARGIPPGTVPDSQDDLVNTATKIGKQVIDTATDAARGMPTGTVPKSKKDKDVNKPLDENTTCNMTEQGRACSKHGVMECPGYSQLMGEAFKMPPESLQDRMYRQHQELRKKRGAPDPSHYKELAKKKQQEIDALRAEIAADKAKGLKEDRYLEELQRAGYEVIAEKKVTQRLDPKCWKGKHKEGTKIKGGVRVNNCVPNK